MRFSALFALALIALHLTCLSHLQADESAVSLDPAQLELGQIDGDTQLTRTVAIRAAAPAAVTRLLSTCPCVSLAADHSLPAQLQAGQALTVTVTIDPTSYEGSFSKIAFVETQTGQTKPTMHRLTVTGTIQVEGGWDDWGDDEPTAAHDEEAPPSPQPTAWEPGMSMDQLKSHLVLFLTPNCDHCNWVRLIWLPRYYDAHPQAQIYTVDLSTQHGLDLLLAFEEAANPATKGDAPVAWQAGHLHYGTQAIDRLLTD